MDISKRKRINKKQQELLIERLHVHTEVIRGNQASTAYKDLWAALSEELNTYGCSRSAEEWQHIWGIMVAKTKRKAREVREALTATGGGPSDGRTIGDLDSKILDIVGSASVHGFAALEAGLQTITTVQPAATVMVLDAGDTEEPASPAPGPIRTRRRRTQRSARPHPSANAQLVEALNANSHRLAESIIEAAKILAAAIQALAAPIEPNNSI